MPHYENVPFEIPDNWVWTTVNDISKSIIYGVSESAKSEGKYKLLRITDIQNNKVDWETVPFTDFDDDKVASYILYDGDIVFARTGATVGKSYLIKGLNQKVIYASYLIRVQTSDLILPEYVKLFFESGYYWEQIELNSVGIGQPNVNGTILGSLNIPLPPFAEQKRIVIEIGRWLSLIDQIEDGKDNLQSTLKQTKSKILDLAIHGCLVPQDPNDEPAIELLKRTNPNFTPCDNAQYENLPNGWLIVDFNSIFETISSKPYQIKQSQIKSHGIRPVVSQSMNHIEGYTDEANYLHLQSPVLVFGDHTRIVKYIDFDFVVGADGVKIINPFFYQRYAYYMILYASINIEDKGYSRHFCQIAKFTYCLPPLKEQIRIVAKIEELSAQLDKIESSLQA